MNKSSQRKFDDFFAETRNPLHRNGFADASFSATIDNKNSGCKMGRYAMIQYVFSRPKLKYLQDRGKRSAPLMILGSTDLSLW